MSAAILRSYAMVLFSQELWFGALLLLATFFNPVAGIAGLSAVCAAVVIAYLSGLPEENISTGLYSFNALLIGVGMGTFYEGGYAFVAVLLTAVLLSVLLSVTLGGWLGKYGLPFLSLPFVLVFWMIMTAAEHFSNLGLSQRNIYWMNEMYAVGGKGLVDTVTATENAPIPEVVKTFFRSFSALFFQGNVLPGFLIALGLFFYSRIAFTLAVIGFAAAYTFGSVAGDAAIATAYYHLGGNYMMTAIAIGAFFCIPSWRSYMWAVWTIPLVALLIAGLSKIFATWWLPVFSLPFCIVVILLLYFLKFRVTANGLQLVIVQHYSPEKNLYLFLNSSERLKDSHYFRFYLPFLGEWMVTQGYEGKITHKGDWSKALDFMILDEELKTFSGNGAQCADFYCFGKPVLAPADGVVEDVLDGIEDNAIGQVNTENNWGNTIVIRHLPGLYTKLSHLRKYSIKVKKGDFIRNGDVIAQCGNSGRSPEPHLHFQVQAWPDIASRTIAYPLAYYLQRDGNQQEMKSFSVPNEGVFVSNVEINPLLQKAFAFQPGFHTSFEIKNGKETITEEWEVATDAWNRTYIFVRGTTTVAYFVNNRTMFYFTSFYGNENTLLYRFYLSCYKVPLAHHSQETNDTFPLYLFRQGPLRWMQDVIAPFRIFLAYRFRLKFTEMDDPYRTTFLRFESGTGSQGWTGYKNLTSSEVTLREGRIDHLLFSANGKTVEAICTSES